MRIAIVSDIHGNLSALDAIVTDISLAAPDLVVQGGDLALMGPRPAEVIDRVRELGWPGVVGNTDEMLWNFEAVPAAVREVFGLMAGTTRELLGEERIRGLQTLPRRWAGDGVALVHAVPGNLWTIIPPDADDTVLAQTYGSLGAAVAVYGHIHRPYVRRLQNLVVANSGSVGLPFDGDTRASYLLIEDGEPAIRRVEYDLERELALLATSGYPFAEANIAARHRAVPPVWPA